jgi:hypothetical protein
MTTITTMDACAAAAATVGAATGWHVGQPTGGYSNNGDGWPPGCTLHSGWLGNRPQFFATDGSNRG